MALVQPLGNPYTVGQQLPIGAPGTLTTQWMLNEQQIVVAELNQIQPSGLSLRQEFDDTIARQRVVEIALLQANNACVGANLDTIQEHLASLPAAKLTAGLANSFYNPAVMQSAACAISAMFYVPHLGPGMLPSNDRVRSYLLNPRQIGADSVNGLALLVSLRNAPDAMIVKVSQNPKNAAELLHEAPVGIMGTNRLRRSCPNFSYILGNVKGSPPLIDPTTKQVVTWCLHENPKVSADYVVYENIRPGTAAGEAMATATPQEFLECQLQIVYAELAGRAVNFTHYDAHSGNILKHVPSHVPGVPSTIANGKPFQIGYQTERGYEYLTTTCVWTFIDYGMTHITTPALSGELLHLGSTQNQVSNAVYPDRSYPFMDLYKFLLTSLIPVYFSKRDAQRDNDLVTLARAEAVMVEGRKIFRYFNTIDRLEDAIMQQGSLFYALPLTETTANLSIEDYANYIRTNCDCSFIGARDSRYGLLDCDNMCVGQNAILRDLALTNATMAVPTDVLNMYDLTMHFQNEGKKEQEQYIIDRFDYATAMPKHIAKMQELYNFIDEIVRTAALYELTSNQDQANLLNPTIVAGISKMYLDAAAVVDATMDLHLYERCGVALAQTYEREQDVISMQTLKSRFEREVRPMINQLKDAVDMTENVLKRFQWRDGLWYDNGRRAYAAAVLDTIIP